MSTKEGELTPVDVLLKDLAGQVAKKGTGSITVSMENAPGFLKESVEKKTKKGIKYKGLTLPYKITFPAVPVVVYDESLGIPTISFSAVAHAEGPAVNNNLTLSVVIGNAAGNLTELETLGYTISPSTVKGFDIQAAAGEFMAGTNLNTTITTGVQEDAASFGAIIESVAYAVSSKGLELNATGHKK